MSSFLHNRQPMLHSNRDGFGSATIKCTNISTFLSSLKSIYDRQFINIPQLEVVSTRNRFFPNSEIVIVFYVIFVRNDKKLMSFLLLPDVLTIEKQRQQKRLTKLMHFRLREVFLFPQIKWKGDARNAFCHSRGHFRVWRALLDGLRKKKDYVLSKCI